MRQVEEHLNKFKTHSLSVDTDARGQRVDFVVQVQRSRRGPFDQMSLLLTS